MDASVADVDSWDLCDGCCTMLFDRTPLAVDRIHVVGRRRAGVRQAVGVRDDRGLAWHDLDADDASSGSSSPDRTRVLDERRYVWKGVNWRCGRSASGATRLHGEAIAAPRSVLAQDSGSARWIAKDALRELLTGDRGDARPRGARG